MASNLFFVFVNLNSGPNAPSFHIVPSQTVGDYSCTLHEQWLSGKKHNGEERKNTAMRTFKDLDNQYLNRWDLLGL